MVVWDGFIEWFVGYQGSKNWVYSSSVFGCYNISHRNQTHRHSAKATPNTTPTPLHTRQPPQGSMCNLPAILQLEHFQPPQHLQLPQPGFRYPITPLEPQLGQPGVPLEGPQLGPCNLLTCAQVQGLKCTQGPQHRYDTVLQLLAASQ